MIAKFVWSRFNNAWVFKGTDNKEARFTQKHADIAAKVLRDEAPPTSIPIKSVMIEFKD